MWDKPHGYASQTWKSIVKSAEVVKRGLNWRPGDGSLIKFCLDRWLFEVPLIDLVQYQIPDSEFAKRVKTIE